jgi:hypothetical protein
VPADDKKTRNYFVADVIVRALDGMDLRPPELPPEKLDALRTTLEAQLSAEEKPE